MKKLLFSFLIFFYSPALFAFSQENLIELLQKPYNIQGEFSQQRHLNGLQKPIISSGKFVLVKGKGLFWETKEPFANQLRIVNKGIGQWNGSKWVSNDKFGQAQQIQIFLGLLSGDIQSLENQFELNLQGTSSHWKLLLIPNTILMKQIFNQIIIEGSDSVENIELYEKQGDTIFIRFNNQQFDKPIIKFVQEALQ